jgi:hypothetical protein
MKTEATMRIRFLRGEKTVGVPYGQRTMTRRMARMDLGPAIMPLMTADALEALGTAGVEVVVDRGRLRLAGGWRDIGPAL